MNSFIVFNFSKAFIATSLNLNKFAVILKNLQHPKISSIHVTSFNCNYFVLKYYSK